VDSTHISLEFSIIVKFGSSISSITRKLADEIHREILTDLGLETTQITINIAGVRSRKVARRNAEVVYRYAAD
jgi:uncharacterized alkaline shock family protein YloU